VSSDGVAFALEPGTRVSGGSPRLLRLDDGRVRMYYNAFPATGFTSAVSSDDGLTFTPEPGERITAAAAGLPNVTNPGIVRMGGLWRAYFSDGSAQSAPFTPHAIKSATSSDLLNWTMDPGVRVGIGAPLTGSAVHPSAIANADGSVTLFFGREGQVGQSAFYIWSATSTDGLTFPSETQLESLGKGNDPDIVRVGNGLRIYYGWGDANSGTIYSAFNATGALGDTASTADAQLTLLNVKAIEATRNQRPAIRALTDQVLNLMSPVQIPATHSVRERIARAEENFRFNWHRSISEADAAEALNAFVYAVGAPEWATVNLDLVHSVRIQLQPRAPQLIGTLRSGSHALDVSIEMSPIEAITLMLSVANNKLTDPGQQVTPDVRSLLQRPGSTVRQASTNRVPGGLWTAARFALERSLSDETSAASRQAHRVLDSLGIRR
jgi:hypothetical protein